MSAPASFALVLTRLRSIRTVEPQVVSCYVRLDGAARADGRYLAEAKARIRELGTWLDSSGLRKEVRRNLDADLRTLTEWLAHAANLPHAPGVAVFLCRELGVFDVIPLGRVHRTRVAADHLPLLQELVGAQEALGRYLGALFDRSHARFFDVSGLEAIELPGLAPRARRGGKYKSDRGDAPGWGERRYQGRLEEEKLRHYARVTSELLRLTSGTAYRGLALLGPADHTQAVQRFLPRRLAGILMGARSLNPTSATPDQVHRAVWELEREQERAQEAALVTAMENGVPTGWAVNGPRETLRVLARGQLRTLLVPVEQHGAGFRCTGSGRLVLARGECQGEGEPEPVGNLVDRAIDDALAQGTEVVVIDDPELAGRVDGLAGVLRFVQSRPRNRRRRATPASVTR